MRAVDRIIIESGSYWSYYQWFLLGIYRLSDEFGYKVEARVPLSEWGYFHVPGKSRVSRVGLGVVSGKLGKPLDFCCYGKVEYTDGTSKRFALDMQDSPYMFSLRGLGSVDAYFKMQCPIDLDAEAYRLAPGVEIPWSATEHADGSPDPRDGHGPRGLIDLGPFRSRIHPIMIGPRRLAGSCTRGGLEAGYENYLSSRGSGKKGTLMCYFGDSEGPVPSSETDFGRFDVNSESQIVSFYAGKIEHPNVKRAKVADIIGSLGEGYDSRVIRRGNSDSGRSGKDRSLVVPLEDFCRHIAGFSYNFNVSGYRKSIPNRFIESFMVDTAIMTDELSIRWYLPFDDEVRETVEMGYLRDCDVDWAQVERDIRGLRPEADLAARVRDAYERKWSPEAVARYMLDVLDQS